MKRFMLVCATVVSMLFLLVLSSPVALAANAHAKVVSSCTFNFKSGSLITDKTHTNVIIGEVDIWADGCGYVWGEALATYPGTPGYINHLQFRNRANGQLLYEVPYSGTNKNSAYYYAGSICVYIVGIVQIPAKGYWGGSQTLCFT